jgi:hypothetical protein
MFLVSTRRGALVVLGAAALLAGPAWAAPPRAGDPDGDADRKLQRTFTVASPGPVRIDLRYGDLHVEPGSAGEVGAELRIRCREGSRRCAENIEKIDLEAVPSGRDFELRVVGLPRFSNHGTEIELWVRVPPGGSLDVDVGAGQVRVTDLESDLRVDLGAGEIEVRMPESAVRSVEASARVGDARLSHGGGEVSERRHLVGARVDWGDGPGEATVDLQVGAGEVAVRLFD